MKTFNFLTAFIFSLSFSFAQTDSVRIRELVGLSLEELMNIKVVTASRTPQKIFEAPSTIFVITKEQIAERGYESVNDALRDLAGIDFINTNGLVPVVKTFRGMYGDENRRILVMIDGIVTNPLNGANSTAEPSMSLHNIERIEVLWGPGSALYGANAYGGVINLITKKGAAINGFSYQRGYGSFNTIFDKTLLGVNKSNFDIAISASLLNSDGPRFTNRHPLYHNSFIENAWSFNGRIEYRFKKSKTRLGFWAFDTPIGNGTTVNSPTQLYGLPSQGHEVTGSTGGLVADIGGQKPSFLETYTRSGYLENEIFVSEKFSVNLSLLYRETGLTPQSYVFLPDASLNNKVQRKSWFTYYNNRTGSEISAQYLSEIHQVYAGLQFNQDNLESGYRSLIPDSRIDTIDLIPVSNLYPTFKERVFTIQNNFGAYAQYELSAAFLRKTNLTLGTRYDYNNVYGPTINPRVGIINQPVDKITFKFLFGTAFRAPTVFELYTVSASRIANPDLEPEKVTSYDISVLFSPTTKYLFRLSSYQNYLTNLIISDVLIKPGVTQNRNIGTARTTGMEARADMILSKKFSTFLNFTWQEGYTNDGAISMPMPNIAKIKGNIGIAINVQDLMTLSIIENMVGPRSVYPTNPLGKVKGYFFSTGKFFNERISASINIRNLTNQTYYDPGWRPNSNLFGTIHEQAGINGILKISMSI